jgi:hypothetical protein
MATFMVRKKDILALTFRALALVILWSLVGINLYFLPELIHKINLGRVQDIFIGFDAPDNGERYVRFVSQDAMDAGVTAGDWVLNPQAHTKGDVGTPVTFLLKSREGEQPAYQVTFLRKPLFREDYIGTLLPWLSPQASLSLEASLLLSTFFLAGLLALLAFWRGWDALTAFLFVITFSLLFSFFLGLQWVVLNVIFPAALIFLLIHFPNGKLSPHWSWLLVFLPLPHLISRVVLFWAPSNYTIFNLMDIFSPLIVLLIFWGLVHRYRDSLAPLDGKRLSWLILALLLIFLPRQLFQLHSLSRLIPDQGANMMVYGFGFFDLTFFRINRTIYSVSKTFHYLGVMPVLMLFGFVIYRYLHTFTPVERQQMKWIVLGLIVVEVPLLIAYMFFAYYYSSFQVDWEQLSISRIDNQPVPINFLVLIMDKLLLLEWIVTALAILLALLRIRLHDIDTWIRRSLVYGGLMLTAGVVCLLTISFVDHTLYDVSSGRKAFLVIMFSAVLFALMFRPARLLFQKLVETYFGSEEFDFEEIFPEFTPEMYAAFSVPQLSQRLAERSIEQFQVPYASVFIKNRNGKLQHIHTASVEKRNPKPVIKTQALSELKKGEVVLADSSPYSLVTPLVMPSGRKPDLVGALILGPRLNEFGYSSEMKKRLKTFGEQVGKVFYIAQLRKQR